MAAQPKFTPGPWTLSDDPVRRVIKGVVSPDRPHGGCPVTVCIIEDWTTEPDARLIAAAPRMYEELAKADALLRQIEDFFLGMKRVNRPLWFDKVQDTIAGTSGALQKADGDA